MPCTFVSTVLHQPSSGAQNHPEVPDEIVLLHVITKWDEIQIPAHQMRGSGVIRFLIDFMEQVGSLYVDSCDIFDG